MYRPFVILLGFLASLALAQPGLELPTGYTASVVVTGLRGPTQMIWGPDDRLWVAQLAGGENEGVGQVVAVSPGRAHEVLLEGIFKPTGIAVLEGNLWIAAGNRLLRAPLAGLGVGKPKVVLRNLPFNGRSNGTLTATSEGLLFETSGRLTARGVQEDSGVLWRLDPARPTEPEPLATGLKGAYAHALDAAGRLYTAEIGDDLVNGRAPPDELNRVVEGANYGWPQCFGRGRPARNYGGTAARCRETEAPLALFPANSTPTSVALSPFEEGALLVALWGPVNAGVVRVDVETGEVTPFVAGLRAPQHLLGAPEGSLLVSDFATGTVYRVTRR